MQTSDEQTDGRVTKLREQLLRVLADKHEAGLCRFGAILAFGLLDAGPDEGAPLQSITQMTNK